MWEFVWGQALNCTCVTGKGIFEVNEAQRTAAHNAVNSMIVAHGSPRT